MSPVTVMAYNLGNGYRMVFWWTLTAKQDQSPFEIFISQDFGALP